MLLLVFVETSPTCLKRMKRWYSIKCLISINLLYRQTAAPSPSRKSFVESWFWFSWQLPGLELLRYQSMKRLCTIIIQNFQFLKATYNAENNITNMPSLESDDCENVNVSSYSNCFTFAHFFHSFLLRSSVVGSAQHGQFSSFLSIFFATAWATDAQPKQQKAFRRCSSLRTQV